MLLDMFLPDYDVHEYHAVEVGMPIERVYPALRTADFGTSPIVRSLLVLRGLPLLLQPRAKRLRRRSMTLDDVLHNGFILLGERPEQEIVLGLVGRFWTPSGDIVRVPADQFRDFVEPGYAKAAWNFAVKTDMHGRVQVSTETRVSCLDLRSRKRFRRYWMLIRPWSGLIRREMLRSVKRVAEHS